MAQLGKKMVLVNVEPKDKLGETYKIIKDAGYNLILGKDGWDHPKDEYAEDELIELCRDADAIIVGSRDLFTRKVIESLPRLRIISKHGTGVDRIDIEAATENGVIVTNTPVHSPVVAEHTVSLMLCLMKRIREADKRVRQGGWRTDDLQSSVVRDKIIGLVGYGRIGSEVAKRLQGWGVKIVAYDPYASAELFDKYGVERSTNFEDMVKEVDVLSLHALLTEETRHLINKDVFCNMKNTALIINTSRGEIIDEQALVMALEEKKIAGAALDVLQQEPPDPSNKLLSMENVVLTPHMSSLVPEIASLLRFTAMENALSALKGEIPKYVKNPEVIDLWKKRFTNN